MIKNPIWNLYLLLFLVFSFTSVIAQDVTFQRILPGIDRNMYNMACEPTADGGFYLLNIAEDLTAPAMDSFINVSKHDPKGNMTWSVDYTIRNLKFFTNFKFLDIENIGNDTLGLVSIFYDSQGLTNGQLIMKIDPRSGEPLFSGMIKNNNEISNPTFFTKMLRDPFDDIHVFGSYSDPDSVLYMHVEKLNRQFDSDTSKSFRATNTNGDTLFTFFCDATVTMDSSLALSCALLEGGSLQEFGFLVLDTSYNMSVAASYSMQGVFYDGLQMFAMSETRDTGYVFVGSYVNLMTGGNVGFAMKTDSIGDVEWAYNINGISLSSLSLPNDVLYTEKDEIMITGKSVDVLSGDLLDFAVFLDDDGNIIRQVQYNSDNSFFLDIASGLILLSGDTKNSPDGTILHATSGIDLTKGGIFTPLVFKTDREGAAICHDSITNDFLTDLVFVRDTMLFIEGNISDRDTILTEIDNFFDYDIPVLTLLDTVFCPQDPIDVTLGSEFEFASAYIWSTGDTTPTLRVMDEGEYMVTVTFDVGVCFELCDTSTISRKDFPMANIGVDLSGLCALDQILLNAGSTTEVVIAAWSTGDTINPLVVTEGGDYSVTITDGCENTASADLSIDDAAFDLSVGILKNSDDFCETGEVILSVSSLSILDGASYAWSNGETTPSIVVTEAGIYTVVVTDMCGDTAEASIEIKEEEVSIVLSIGRDNSRRCEFQEMGLRADSPNPIISYQWSTGETSKLIIIDQPGEYSVTVTDVCGNTEEAMITISSSELDFSINPIIELDYTLNYVLSCLVDLNVIVGNTLFDIESIVWNQGSTNPSITISEAGLYSVVVTDICGNTGTAQINVTEDDLSSPDDKLNVTIRESGSCDSLVYRLSIESYPGLQNIEWSTGSTADSIQVSTPGLYSVTVTDVCGNTATDEREIIFDVLRFPNIFFPVNAEHDENKLFRPFVSCPELFTGDNYSLEVYNRWNNRVFETTNVEQGWNGIYSGSNAPEGVYIYYAVWTDSNGEQQKANGNVTLIR